jgi:hypothetical protein
MKTVCSAALVFVLFLASLAHAGGGHGPLYAYGTTTNARGQWSLDFGAIIIRDQDNTGVYFEPSISYGITEKLTMTAAVPGITGESESLTPALGSYRATVMWRFHQNNSAVGKRFENAIFGGFLYPARQFGVLKLVEKTPGAMIGYSSGLISRSHYFWAGISYTRFAGKDGDQRPALITYSAAYAYRPAAWRKDYPAWDWRILAESTGEAFHDLKINGIVLKDTDEHQIFLGPSLLGQKRSVAVEAGLQIAVYRNTGLKTGERFRFGVAASLFL